MDKDNDTLVSRFDGSILDGKAWGAGLQSPQDAWPVERRNSAEAALRLLEVNFQGFDACQQTGRQKARLNRWSH